MGDASEGMAVLRLTRCASDNVEPVLPVAPVTGNQYRLTTGCVDNSARMRCRCFPIPTCQREALT